MTINRKKIAYRFIADFLTAEIEDVRADPAAQAYEGIDIIDFVDELASIRDAMAAAGHLEVASDGALGATSADVGRSADAGATSDGLTR